MSLLKKVEPKSLRELDESKPSLQNAGTKKGLDLHAIHRLEHLGSSLILHVGARLSLPVNVTHTAVHYFHRFYAQHKFQEQDRLQVATACLFLATKVEESPRHLKNIIQEVYITRYRQHPSVRKKLLNEPRVYEMIKDRVLVVERSLLYTVGFDFNVDTPYKFLVDLRNLLDDYLKHAFPSGVPESMYQPAPLDGEARGKKVPVSFHVQQAAWNFANDSMRLTLSLQFSAVKIALVCFYLAIKRVNKTFGNCFKGLYKTDKEGNKQFHEFFCDMMNFASTKYWGRADGREGRVLSPEEKSRRDEEDAKRVGYQIIRQEHDKMTYDEIQSCVMQITKMYEQVTAEDGEIVAPKGYQLAEAKMKETEGGMKGGGPASSPNGDEFSPIESQPSTTPEAAKERPREGNGVGQDKDGEEPAGKKQKVGEES